MKIKKNVVTFNFGTAATPINVTLPHNYAQRIGVIDIDGRNKDILQRFVHNVQIYERIFTTYPESLPYRLMCKVMCTHIREMPDLENSMVEWLDSNIDSRDREAKKVRSIIRKIIDYTGLEIFKDQQRVKSFCS